MFAVACDATNCICDPESSADDMLAMATPAEGGELLAWESFLADSWSF